MNIFRLCFYCAFVFLFASDANVSAQSSASMSYDVSTVKLARQGSIVSNINWGRDELKVDNTTLLSLMANAFHARPDQISGQPSWASDLHFDITAKLTDSDPETLAKLKGEQHRALIRALLVERFGLKYHEETREMQIYELEPAKGGLKLTPATSSGDTSSLNGVCSGCIFIGAHDIRAHDFEMTNFIEVLGKILKRTVNDRVHYPGKIDINLRWEPDVVTGDSSAEDASLPPLPIALEEQMGLHLFAMRGPVTIYVIDHLQKPSGN